MFPQQSPKGAVSESGGRSGTMIWVLIVVALAAVPAFVPPNFEEISREYRRNLLEICDLALHVLGLGTLVYWVLKGSVIK